MLPYLVAFALVALPVYAQAKDDVEEDLAPLIERPEEKVYESDKAMKVSVGGMTGLSYNDNIYRSSTGETDDFIGIFRPGIRVKTDMRPYRLDLGGNVEVGRYFSEGENDYVDADINGRAGYDINSTTNIYVGGRHQIDHVAIGAFTDTIDNQVAKPTDYTYSEVNAGLKVDAPAWVAHLHGGIDFYNYDNNTRRDGSLVINDDRDRDERHVTARLGYKLNLDTVWYVQGTYNNRAYDQRIDSTSLVSRDSDGAEFLTGLKMGEKHDPIYAEFAVGYLEQNYDSAALPDVSALALNGRFQWLPDEFWHLAGTLTREVRETTTTAASAYLQTRAALDLAYDLFSDLTLGTRLRYTQNDFKVNQSAGGTERTDNVYDGSIYADYTFFEQYVLGAEYLHVSRDSDVALADYDSNVFLLRVGVLY